MPPIPDWARAHGTPELQGYIRQSASDFEVTENLGFALTGDGEHDYLWLEKEGVNTPWLAAKLARHAGIREAEVGFAGMKDRKAVARQWFSVRRPTAAGTDWSRLELPGVRILEETRHDRKLKRGALKCNDFRIAIRGVDATRETIERRLELVKKMGVPNYFGDQRFGREGSNLRTAGELFAGKRINRNQRGIALSAARAFLFNQILQQRVRDGSWNQLLPGECACLDGSNSFFVFDRLDDDLVRRLETLDIHPGGALWGSGESPCHGEIVALERSAVAPFTELREGLESHVEQSRRALRLAVRNLEWELDHQTLWLRFRLCRGGYATVVLREIAILSS